MFCSEGRFVHWMFSRSERFVKGHFVEGCLMEGLFVEGRYLGGHFVLAPFSGVQNATIDIIATCQLPTQLP